MYINRKKNKLKIESVPTVLMTEKQVISTVLAARLICGIKLRCFFFFFQRHNREYNANIHKRELLSF